MTSLRELWRRARIHAEAARVQSLDRPTSLFAAGSVGNQIRAVVRPETPVAPEATPRPRDFPVERMATDVENRPARTQRRTPMVRSSRSRLAAELRSPAALRRAIVMREILGPPTALRDERPD